MTVRGRRQGAEGRERKADRDRALCALCCSALLCSGLGVVRPSASPDLATTRSPTVRTAVPWALRRFTAEFGMGSGGSAALWSPGRARRSGGLADAASGLGWMIALRVILDCWLDDRWSDPDPPPTPCQPPWS